MLYFFYGSECPHCHEVLPIVDKLIKEGTEITKLETWHDEKNAAQLEKVDAGKCGGVPFFWNETSKQWICGSASEEKIRAWAKGDAMQE